MSILITYASKHGSTQQIAERIAERLRANGLEATVQPMTAVNDLAGYDAFVIGSAVYFGSWLGEAREFVQRHRGALAGRPVWLFSSGPLGTSTTDAQEHDLLDAAIPAEIAAYRHAIQPRDHRVFFGALDHTRLGFIERLLRALPAGRELLVEGDARDWAAIESWAASIAQELAPSAAHTS
jgi:menaquinone-dependent protoporphyrinogen oxidase